MEENLPNDRLEEFLRKSFEGHSESPPDDLWAKIEAGLEPPVAAPRLTFRRWGWAAAAAVLAGLLIFQHLYFNQKIERLDEALEKNATELKALEGSQVAESQAIVPPTGQGAPPADAVGGQPAGSPPAETTGRAGTNFTKEKKQVSDSGNTPLAASPVAGLEEKNGQGLAPPPTLETPTENSETPKPAAVPSLLSSKNGLLKTPATVPFSALGLASVASKNNAPAGKFSVGVHALPMFTWQKINAQRPPSTPQPVVDNEVENSGQSLLAGLAVEAKLTPRLSLGSGVGYRRTVFESRHRANFRFKDRRGHLPHQPGTGDNQYDFEYNLNTPAGMVDVEVRAESTDTTLQIPDDEAIGLNIKTRQTLEHVSLPLYAGYSLGKGRLRATLKAGFLLNFLIDNDFEITDISSPNPKFRFRRGSGQRGRPLNLQSVSVDYIAGIGLDYRLTKSWSLRLEPTVVGSLTSLHNNPFIDSSQFSAGLNVGVMYAF